MQPSQLEEGATIYAAQCAGCHGSAGGGGVGRPMTDGSLIATFPDILGQLRVRLDRQRRRRPGRHRLRRPEPRGRRPTPRLSYNGNKMPNFDGSLTQAELLAVVRYEREVLSGAEIDATQVAADGTMLWPDGNADARRQRQPHHPRG